MSESADFSVENHGSLFLLRPESELAEEWVNDHLPPDAQRFGGAVVVEPRYIADILNGAQGDGLAIA